MRMTVTIEDDLAATLKRRARELGVPLRDLINRALRAGLAEQGVSAQRVPPKTIPHEFGFRPGIDLNRLGKLADELEDEIYAAEQRASRVRYRKRHGPAEG
jgi:hypothetical protein